MSLYGMMRTSVSGMAAQASRLSAVADNIANANTTGYKRATVQFSSLIPQSNGGQYESGGVETKIRHAISDQGNPRYTTSGTDLALNGDGFFIVSDGDGTPYLTRSGSFVPDSAGNLVNTSGFYLMGYPYDGTGINTVVNGFTGLEPVNISQFSLQASPSQAGIFTANLPSGAADVPVASLPSTNVAGAEYTQKTSLVAYDNLGNEVVLDLYFSKTASGTWEVAAFDSADASASGGFPYSSGPLASDTLSFDLTTGDLLAASASSLSIPVPNGQTLTLDMSSMTQIAGDYNIYTAIVDGSAPSAIDDIQIASDGTVYARFANGSQTPIFKIPIADVPSPDGLITLPGNVFAPGINSGDVRIGFAGTDGMATITAGALEESNVDIAEELTAMIEAQRSYTANSKVFQTGSDLMDVLVNLKR